MTVFTDKQLKKTPLKKIKQSLDANCLIPSLLGRGSGKAFYTHLTNIITILLKCSNVKQPRKQKKKLTKMLVFYYKIYRECYLKPALKITKTM